MTNPSRDVPEVRSECRDGALEVAEVAASEEEGVEPDDVVAGFEESWPEEASDVALVAGEQNPHEGDRPGEGPPERRPRREVSGGL